MLGEDRGLRVRPLLILLAALLLVVSACSGDGGESAGSEDSAAPSPSATPSPPPAPKQGACTRLRYQDALSPTTDRKPVRCAKPHTAYTFFVGGMRTAVDGHLLAVDSKRVQDDIASQCRAKYDGFLGGTEEQRRLSMFSAVWFSPTVEESEAGANWFRCEVIAVAGPEKLADLPRDPQGILDDAEARERWGMCGTAKPGSKDFQRVPCSANHSWRAIATVDIKGGKNGAWPGKEAVKAAGQTRCEDLARAEAADPLSFSWGYEWPGRAQWQSDHHYGFCWVPESG